MGGTKKELRRGLKFQKPEEQLARECLAQRRLDSGKDSGLETQVEEPSVAGGHQNQANGWIHDLQKAGGRGRQSRKDGG